MAGTYYLFYSGRQGTAWTGCYSITGPTQKEVKKLPTVSKQLKLFISYSDFSEYSFCPQKRGGSS